MSNEKREAIDQFIHKHSGKFPTPPTSIITEVHGVLYDSNYGEVPCDRIQFYKRAKELGYINGYKYGVEYPTNGKKPDLPGDVVVDVKCVKWSGFGEWPNRAGAWNWHDVEKFKITDERYKPKATSKPEVGNWHERGELPPVGWKGQYGAFWHPCEVVAHHNGFAVVWDAHDLEYFRTNKSHIFRPIQTERDKVIANAEHAIESKTGEPANSAHLGILYDIGALKLPEGE